MNEKLLVETAVLAGEIMLVSGAEIYRVEDTINHMLKRAGLGNPEAIVLSTGIFASLDSRTGDLVTVIRRVSERGTNLNKVYLVNNISRKFCGGEITVEEANLLLREVQDAASYRGLVKNLGYIGVSVFFTLLLGGGFVDCVGASVVGAILAGVLWLSKRIGLNDFCVNAVGAFAVASSALCVKHWIVMAVNVDKVMIGSIMSLVPGVIFTTAIRDTLNGDYSSGAARMLEAIVTALAVAVGVGAGMFLFGRLLGGGLSW